MKEGKVGLFTVPIGALPARGVLINIDQVARVAAVALVAPHVRNNLLALAQSRASPLTVILRQ